MISARVFVLAILLVAAVAAGAYWYMLGMPGRRYSGPLPAFTEAEREMAATLRGHVDAIASRPHNTSFPDELEKSARYIEQQLISYGYEPSAQKFMAAGIEVRNIEVAIEAADPANAETLVVGAHYDSAGDAPGANDNGSGVAALLVLARELKGHRGGKRLRLVFFVNEEPPHFKTETMGSLVYARALDERGERVAAMLSLETLGCYSDAPRSQTYPPILSGVMPDVGDFVAVVGALGARPIAADVMRLFRDSTDFPSEGGVAPGWIPGITWSDHWSFGRFGIPSVMITDTALFRYEHYHEPTDTPDKLDYGRLARVTTGLLSVVRGLSPAATGF